MLRLVFMGTPAFAVPSLRAAVGAGHRVLAVVTAPDKPYGRGLARKSPEVKQEAERLGLDVIQPERVDTEKFLGWLKRLSPDCVVVVACGHKLPRSVLEVPSKGTINVHASLLPEYRGAAPIRRCIMDGCRATGVTTMHLSEEWDAGDIILQEEVAVPEEMTGGELEELLGQRGAALLARTLGAIEAGCAPRIPQDHSRATYARRLAREDALVDWARPSEDIRNLVRAMCPAPGAYTFLGDRLLKVFRVKVNATPEGQPAAALGARAECTDAAVPGQVLGFGEAGIRVRTGDGEIAITELCAEGGRRLTAPEFVRGRPIAPGTILGGGR